MTTKYFVVRTEVVTTKSLYDVDVIGSDKPISYVREATPVSVVIERDVSFDEFAVLKKSGGI